MSLSIDLDGRVAVVTGATRGIGLSIARTLAEAGAGVVATGTGDHPTEPLAELLEDAPAGSTYVSLDLGAEQSLADFRQRLEGPDQVDILVNNAGINDIVEVHEIDLASYDRLHNIDLRGPIALSGSVVPGMRDRGWGRIVNVASIWATITKPGRAMYTASKFGLVGFTKTLAVENAPWGILANAVSPGFTLTELTRSTLTPEEIEALGQQVPANRFAEPEEMAQVVAFLVSPLNTYLTAQNVTIDGGFTSI
ncbi:MAG: SDR family oxidoreductase [Longimicrobiales bacterium]|nr:SDR family oxidoreductase [Longimicrobiales bacterium]